MPDLPADEATSDREITRAVSSRLSSTADLAAASRLAESAGPDDSVAVRAALRCSCPAAACTWARASASFERMPRSTMTCKPATFGSVACFLASKFEIVPLTDLIKHTACHRAYPAYLELISLCTRTWLAWTMQEVPEVQNKTSLWLNQSCMKKRTRCSMLSVAVRWWLLRFRVTSLYASFANDTGPWPNSIARKCCPWRSRSTQKSRLPSTSRRSHTSL